MLEFRNRFLISQSFTATNLQKYQRPVCDHQFVGSRFYGTAFKGGAVGGEDKRVNPLKKESSRELFKFT